VPVGWPLGTVGLPVRPACTSRCKLVARATAEKVGKGRDDYGTEFGRVNVAIHAVSVAVDLGDAGHALDLAKDLHYQALSPERQARQLIDLAAAHAMRRQIGEAIRDLLQLSGLRPRPNSAISRSDSESCAS